MFWVIVVIVSFVIFIYAIIEMERQKELEQQREIERQKEMERYWEMERQYKELEGNVLKEIGFSNWEIISYIDEYVIVKSRQALEKYDDIKFFKENQEKLAQAENTIVRKNGVSKVLKEFKKHNEYKTSPQYYRIIEQINQILKNAEAYYSIMVS